MLIPVLQRHIDKGQKNSETDCPIANAIRDALRELLGNEHVVEVYYGYQNRLIINYRGSMMLPKSVGNMIKRWEDGQPLEPFDTETVK